MRFDDFEQLAWQHWEKVPQEYKQGVDGLTIERDARAHADHDEVYTLGECVTESFPSEFGGPDTTRSAVVLYYGSFLRLSHLDPSFDWDHELWETLTHELQHHLEALAADDTLEDFDYAVDENFKRQNGEDFDPLFFRAGRAMAGGRYRVEDDVFIELDPGAPEKSPSRIVFEWEGARYGLTRPSRLADVTYIRVTDGPALDQGELWLVLVPRRGAFRVLGDALRGRPLDVTVGEAAAELVA